MANRSGDFCGLCGTEIFNWQEDEFEVLPGKCPECSMEILDHCGGDYDEAETLAEMF